METICDRSRLFITTAWVGSLWTIGYLVAPTLFMIIPDAALAGTIAGRLFHIEAWLSVVCAVSLMACSLFQRQGISKIVIGMLLCTLIGYFALHPLMANLRESGLENPDIKWKFGIIHSISSGIYLVQSVLGALLVLDQFRKNAARQDSQ